MKSWYAFRALAEGAEVSIYDEIGAFGVSAKAFLAELAALPEAAAVTLRLNSPGGSVFDAVAIHNALARRGGVTVWIDGVAASAASYVAMAGETVIMPENAFLMIHDPAGVVMGSAADMRATADALDKIKASLVSGYAAKSGREADEIARLMVEETWLDAAEAVALGFADRIAEPARIVARFDVARFRNAPPALVEAVESEETPEAQQPVEPPPPDPTPDPAPPPDAAAIRAAAMAEARVIADLCRLAGAPEKAAGFLAEAAPVDAVRRALLDARVDAEPVLDPRHAQPGRRSAASPWGEVIARAFKLKG